MSKTNFILLVTVTAIFFYACSDVGPNDDPNDPTTTIPTKPNTTRTDVIFPTDNTTLATSITGSVVDDIGQPISNASVTCLSCTPETTVTSMEDGSFSFQSINNKGGEAFLSVKSQGKFEGYRRFPLIQNRQNYTSLMLRDKKMAGTVSASSGGTVALSSGATLSLPKEGISDEADNLYTGEVEVFMSWIDPSDDELNEIMMGDLSGIGLDNEEVGLSTFGMIQVELETPNGTPLSMTNGAEAELRFPIPQELKNIAPATIPLWSYNETHGYWVEEGSATLEGNFYVGSVSHFSTWNVDTKFDPIDISGEIKLNSRGTEVGLAFFELKLSGDSFTGVGGWLCDDGSFNFANVPAGETLTIEITNYCGETIQTLEVGPFSENTELDAIYISDDESVNEVLIQGNALACDGSIVDNGRIAIYMGNRTLNFPIDAQGNFFFAVPLCSGTYSRMQILNLDDFSTSADIPLSALNNHYTLSDLTVCQVHDEFFYQQWNDLGTGDLTNIFYTNSEDIWYKKVGDNFYFEINYTGTNGTTVLTYSFTQELKLNEIIQGINGDGLISNGPMLMHGETYEFLFTEIGPLNADGNPTIIRGSFKGQLIPDQNVPFNIEATFRLKPQ